MPTNPLKLEVGILIEKWMYPFFSQNWSLFAPNPVAHDFILLIRPEQDSIASKNDADKNWYNLSSPLWKNYKANRLSAYDRLARIPSNALRTYMNGEIWMVDLLKACSNGDSIACKSFQVELDNIREKQKKVIAMVASAFCNGNFPDTYPYVNCRIRIINYPSWAERGSKKPQTTDLDIGIFKIERQIYPLSLVVSKNE